MEYSRDRGKPHGTHRAPEFYKGFGEFGPPKFSTAWIKSRRVQHKAGTGQGRGWHTELQQGVQHLHQAGGRGSISCTAAAAAGAAVAQSSGTEHQRGADRQGSTRAGFPSTGGAAPAQHRAGYQSQFSLAQQKQHQHRAGCQRQFSFPWHSGTSRSSTSTAQSRRPELHSHSTSADQDARGSLVFPGTAEAAGAALALNTGTEQRRPGCQRQFRFPWHSGSSTSTEQQQHARDSISCTAGAAVTQSSGTEQWHRAVAQSSGTELWHRAVTQSSGTEQWHRAVAQSSGTEHQRGADHQDSTRAEFPQHRGSSRSSTGTAQSSTEQDARGRLDFPGTAGAAPAQSRIRVPV
ncbi:uncharacterized protein LOC134561555 [Prinia subflava]|uniref:uncharacterized protein LOC134561555 n=1 Tax=Prinia subflava TaxID=208062 RepID=UPI002FE11EDF